MQKVNNPFGYFASKVRKLRNVSFLRIIKARQQSCMPNDFHPLFQVIWLRLNIALQFDVNTHMGLAKLFGMHIAFIMANEAPGVATMNIGDLEEFEQNMQWKAGKSDFAQREGCIATDRHRERCWVSISWIKNVDH